MQSKKSKLYTIGFNVLLVLAVLLSIVRWFSFEPQKVDLDADEVAWVLDAEVYERYRNGEWGFFSITEKSAHQQWYHPEYRIIDQPQTGKYFLGFFLSLADLKPWQSDVKSDLYFSFAKRNLPEGSLEATREILGTEVYQAILFMRQVHLFLGFLVLIGIALGSFFYTKNKQLGLLLFSMLLNHEGILRQFRLVTVDLYSLFFQFLAVLILSVGFAKLSTGKFSEKSKPLLQSVIWGAAAGVLIAIATSIKLNGAFLVLIPYFLVVFKMYPMVFIEDQIDQSQLVAITTWFVSSIVFGGLVFLLLEPELWSNPVQNLGVLLDARLMQQQRFLNHGGTASFWQMFYILGKVLTQLPLSISLLYVLMLFKNKSILKKNILDLLVLRSHNKHQLLALCMVPIVGATFYYGRVGFERYFYSATIALYSISVIMMSKREHDV